MNIQFYHKRSVAKYVFQLGDIKNITTHLDSRGGTTFALQTPTVEQFKEFKIVDISEDCWEYRLETIELDIGSAKCSKEDNYNKKIGRTIAKGRMKTRVFWIRKHSETEVILVDNQGKYPELTLRLSPDLNKVYFVQVKK